MLAAAVVRRKVGELVDLSGEQAAPEGRVGDERDPQLAQGRKGLLRLHAVEQRVLHLYGGERMDLLRAADGRRRRLREPEEAHLAGLDQSRHRAHLGIDAVLVIEVDHVHAEALETRVARLRHPLGPAVDAGRAVRLAHVAELGDDHGALAPAAQRLAEQRLVVAPAVHVGRVQEVDAEVERAMDDRDRLRVVSGAVRARHRHASEPERADLEGAAAEPPSLDHARLPLTVRRIVVSFVGATGAEDGSTTIAYDDRV